MRPEGYIVIFPPHFRPAPSFAFVVVSCAEDVTRAIEQLNRGKVAGQQIHVKDSRNSFGEYQRIQDGMLWHCKYPINFSLM